MSGPVKGMASDFSPVRQTVDVYRRLTGSAPRDMVLSDDTSFDRHLFACILSVASCDPGRLEINCGLQSTELQRLMALHFPSGTLGIGGAGGDGSALPADVVDEIEILCQLLSMHRSTPGDDGAWLAAMIARRAMETHHLWEDLGLCSRAELTRLMNRHFAPLAQRNVNNMRWKRYLYRAMCEDDGFVMCSTPVCSDCADFDLCFGDESGFGRLVTESRAVPSTGSGIAR